MNKFKAGKAVKILKMTEHYKGRFKVGDTGVIDRFQHDDLYHLVLIGDDSNQDCDCCWHDVDNIELAEDTSKPVKQEYEGNIYQIGQDYLFSINGETWSYGSLTDIDGGYSKPFCTKHKEWRYIKEVPASESMGTITPAPIELIDGNAYMFNPHNTTLLDVIGLYEKKTNQFYCNGWSIILAHCSIIRPMTVAESK
jgi:hypothetical protein